MQSQVPFAVVSLAFSLFLLAGSPAWAQGGGAPSWFAPDRAERVSALIPGRGIRQFTPETLYADWTEAQVARWEAEHGPLDPAALHEEYAARAPVDAEVRAHFPRHISPFGRVLEGNPPAAQRDNVMISWCPFCNGRLDLRWNARNPYVASTACGHRFYAREEDFPPDYAFRPQKTAPFHHLDHVVEVPAYVHTDENGVKWELFLQTVVDYRLWLHYDGLVMDYGRRFAETADPFYVHKVALLLDEIAETYHGLPLSFRNRVATGRGGQPLKRDEWEALERPKIFEQSYLGIWNRKRPLMNRGWAVAESADNAWAGPFALVRQHPVFKQYSLQRYGDENALDRRVTEKVLREIAAMHTVGVLQRGHAYQTSYQYSTYYPLMVAGMLLEDPLIYDFAVPSQEATLYNHHYHDGLNGEGSPVYMLSLGRYYRWMRDPTGWRYFYPDFLEEQPFFNVASTELRKLRTARGLSLEWGDHHILAWGPAVNRAAPATDEERVAAGRARPSRNWPAYGVGLLGFGQGEHRMEANLIYTKESSHGKSDVLGLAVWVDGYPVIRFGGYASSAKEIDPGKAEDRFLMDLPYPRPVACGGGRAWVRRYTDTPLAQNALLVDEVRPASYGPPEGLSRLKTFKGGEARGEPGARFQVLEARNDYAFERVGVPVSDFRRALIGVETPDGRAYMVDVTRATGGSRHMLTYAGWGELADESLDGPASESEDMAAYLAAQPGVPEPGTTNRWHVPKHLFEQIHKVREFRPQAGQWQVTWKTDYGAWAPRPLDGEYERPLPEDTGRVRLRLTGLGDPGEAAILRGKGPWIARVNQPLPGGRRYVGNLVFRDAVDIVSDYRRAPEGGEQDSKFVYLLEGYPEGGEPPLAGKRRLPAPGGAVALELELEGGWRDIVVHQPQPGTQLRLENGLETDAGYALIRLNPQGEAVEAHLARGQYLRYGGREVRGEADRRCTLEDMVGDLTGTRRETAFVVRTEEAWPEGGALAGRDITVVMPNPKRSPTQETYTIESVQRLGENRYRVSLSGAPPLAKGWHSVAWLSPDEPNAFKTNRRVTAGANTPWMWANRAWFPEKGLEYTVERTEDGTGAGGYETVWLEEGADLIADGVEFGDWCVIYEIRPGVEVLVPGHGVWTR